MNYQIQVTYKDSNGWRVTRALKPQKTEKECFDFAEQALRDNGVASAEIWVLKKGTNFWKVRDRQGRVVQRPTTEAKRRAVAAGEG